MVYQCTPCCNTNVSFMKTKNVSNINTAAGHHVVVTQDDSCNNRFILFEGLICGFDLKYMYIH